MTASNRSSAFLFHSALHVPHIKVAAMRPLYPIAILFNVHRVLALAAEKADLYIPAARKVYASRFHLGGPGFPFLI
jgi:hypothetical protein